MIKQSTRIQAGGRNRIATRCCSLFNAKLTRPGIDDNDIDDALETVEVRDSRKPKEVDLEKAKNYIFDLEDSGSLKEKTFCEALELNHGNFNSLSGSLDPSQLVASDLIAFDEMSKRENG